MEQRSRLTELLWCKRPSPWTKPSCWGIFRWRCKAVDDGCRHAGFGGRNAIRLTVHNVRQLNYWVVGRGCDVSPTSLCNSRHFSQLAASIASDWWWFSRRTGRKRRRRRSTNRWKPSSPSRSILKSRLRWWNHLTQTIWAFADADENYCINISRVINGM